MNEWKFGKLQKNYTQNLIRCNIFNSKPDASFFLNPRMTRWTFFNSKSVTYRKFQFKIKLLKKARKLQIMSFSRSKEDQNVIFWMQTFFKIWRLEKFLIQNLTRCIFFNPKSDAMLKLQIKFWRVVKILIQNLTSFKTFFSEIWLLSCCSGSDWLMISSVNVITNLLRTLVTDWTLWSIKDSRSAVFLRIHLCEKRNRSLVRILSIFSKVFAWATRSRPIEKSWHLYRIYPILAAWCYLPQSWHLSKLTMPNRKSKFKTCVAQNVP